jgi:poly(hydroxyalkanoate) depolymerase family esterase
MRVGRAVWLGLVLVACSAGGDGEKLGTGQAPLATLEEVTGFGSNPAGLKMYRYVPAGVGQNAALVVALHGCTQTAQDYTNAGWNALADRLKFYVLYPEQTTANNPMRCFNWAGVYGNPANLRRGEGENLSIKQMIDKMKADGSVDPKRVFITGLSAGAAETALMLATWPELFAAGAPIAGIPYDCAETLLDSTTCMTAGKPKTAKEWGDLVRAADPGFAGPWPRVSVWQGTSDAVVSPTNEKEMSKQWTSAHDLPEAPAQTQKMDHATRSVWNDPSGQVAIEMVAVDGMGHGVPVDPANGCGTAGAYILDAKICSTEKIADFFGLSAPSGGAGAPPAGTSPPGPTTDSRGQGSSAEASGCNASGDGFGAAWALLCVLAEGLRRSRAARKERRS